MQSMSAELTPMRWPDRWKNASALALLNDSPINCPVADSAIPESVVAQAKQKGLTIADPAAPPPGVFITKGQWPGVQALQDKVSAGPTGNPWLDSIQVSVGSDVYTCVAIRQLKCRSANLLCSLPISAWWAPMVSQVSMSARLCTSSNSVVPLW